MWASLKKELTPKIALPLQYRIDMLNGQVLGCLSILPSVLVSWRV